MSGPPWVKSMNLTDPEARPVLGPAGNKARSVELWKPIVKPKTEKTQDAEVTKGKKSPAALKSPEIEPGRSPSPVRLWKNLSGSAAILSRRQSNLSMNASCSSDVSSDSSQSRASTGKISRRSGIQTPPARKKQQFRFKAGKTENKEGNGKKIRDETEEVVIDGAVVKKRCAWLTSNTDPLYTAFHDEEWGVPIHDDKKLFELLSFSTALAELSWPVILTKRQIFRDVFLDFDPIAVSKINEKKFTAHGTPASSLLSELKLRAIIENARQICKIVDEFGSFDKFIWNFVVNYKPIVSNFRYPRQVPIKTSKAETISKDLVRRGFRGVGPTVVYSFMQAAGITNDHLVSCFRYQECMVSDKNEGGVSSTDNEGKAPEDVRVLELVRDIDDLSLSR